jgi:uncharacterized protein YbjQ (UPF0145 family)
MIESTLRNARQLIEQKRYEEAKKLLNTIQANPTAQEWLVKIAKITPSTVLSIQKRDTEIIVTTTDLPQAYDIISPVYFQVSNKGLFGSQLSRLAKQYANELADMRTKGYIDKKRTDWGFLVYGEFSAGQTDFDTAFFVAIRELQKRALLMEADAVVGMRQDIDLDTNGFQFFYLQMYGTAIRFR